MSSCDPCSADPLTPEELAQAGVFWLDSQPEAFITRLHLRYTRDKFPEDLQFQNTPNQELFQGRYVIRHPFTGAIECDAAKTYPREVRNRQETEAKTLANLTGWDINSIREKINFFEVTQSDSPAWWREFWN